MINELSTIYTLKEKYFTPKNFKFRNLVDGLQTHLIEEEIIVTVLKNIRNSIYFRTNYNHKMYDLLISFTIDMPEQDIVEAIDLAIYYFERKDHTEILKELYATILS